MYLVAESCQLSLVTTVENTKHSHKSYCWAKWMLLNQWLGSGPKMKRNQ